MNPLLLTGIAAAVIGAALGFGAAHTIGAEQLAKEQAAHQSDLAKINAASAKALADALSRQQAAQSDVATIQKQFDDEVANHAKDSLDYRARLSAGTDRVRVRIASCAPAAASESAGASGSSDGGSAYGYLDGAVASSVFKVAADDQAEIDKFTALQAYVRAMQEQGFIAGAMPPTP
jgi:glutathione S-transferase